MCFWKRLVDDTLTFVKEESFNHVLQQLNSFHPNIQFTFQIESSGRIPFLDILIIRKKSGIETTVSLKQQFKEKVQTQAFISPESHLYPTYGNEVKR